MGEANEPKKTALAQVGEDAMVVDTMGGRVHVRWDQTAQATPHGQIVFFAEFLATAGVFDRWVQDCPLHYSSPNASRPRDVPGTLMRGILAGSKRYAHIAGVRGDAAAAKALGLRGMVSEDSVRRALAALAAMVPEASEPWMRSALMSSVREALDRPWVLDMDATIKPLYGRQEGARVGYNPHKPGRSEPRVAHLLGWQPAPGARRGAQFGQAAHLGPRQGRDGAAARRTWRQGSGTGARGLWLRQRRHHRRVRAARPALPAAPAQAGQRRAADREAVQARGLDACHRSQSGLAGHRRRAAPERLEPGAPRGGAAPVHQARHRLDFQARGQQARPA
jgi:hypothetical protein